MDAKSKANFINSVASGAVVPCPKCNASNKPDAKNCEVCGEALVAPAEANNAPAFESAKAPAAAPVKYEEPNNVFAKGLPEWSLEPPQVMVRRH